MSTVVRRWLGAVVPIYDRTLKIHPLLSVDVEWYDHIQFQSFDFYLDEYQSHIATNHFHIARYSVLPIPPHSRSLDFHVTILQQYLPWRRVVWTIQIHPFLYIHIVLYDNFRHPLMVYVSHSYMSFGPIERRTVPTLAMPRPHRNLVSQSRNVFFPMYTCKLNIHRVFPICYACSEYPD